MAFIPKDERDWLQRAKTHNIRNTSIHDRDYTNSASNIEIKQFLLLRSHHQLVPLADSESTLDRFLKPGAIAEAKKHLGDVDGWYSYLKSVGERTDRRTHASNYRTLKTYALVKDFQHQTLQFKADFDNLTAQQKVTLFPLGETELSTGDSHPTDPPSPSPIVGPAFGRGRVTRQSAQLQTPAKASSSSKHSAGALPNLMGRLSLQSDPKMNTPEWRSTHGQVPFISTPPVSGAEARDSSIDEQIVNTALILLAQAVILHDPKIKADWSLHRAPLVFTDNHARKVYEARVDGVLRHAETNRILAIMEVKPFARNKGTGTTARDIIMQEGAQIVAWISEDPPVHVKGRDVHRWLISQDRDEIYLTVAVIPEAYTMYVRGIPEHKAGFATLQLMAFGPFDIRNFKHMETAGAFLYALAKQESQ